MRLVRALAREWGRVRVADSRRDSAVSGREERLSGERGEAMLQRWVVRVESCADRAEAMMSTLSKKMAMSPERISRSDREGI